MTTKDLQEGVRKRSIVLSFAVDGDFTFAPSTGFVLPDVPSTTDMIVKKTGGGQPYVDSLVYKFETVSYTHLTLPTT